VIPPLRGIPPSPAQLAADPIAPWTLFVAIDLERLALATAAIGCGLTIGEGVARVSADEGTLNRLVAELDLRSSRLASLIGNLLSQSTAWQLRTRTLELRQGVVLGILNLTDDSFSGDGVGTDISGALWRAEELRAEGADIIDIGAETARADRPTLDAATEAILVGRTVAELVRQGHVVSSDTYKPEVARAALEAGAEIVNDISGLTLGTGAAEAAAAESAGYVLNYSYNVPKRRPDSPPVYKDVVAETVAWMFDRVAELEAHGLHRPNIAIDPGIAFGKSHDEDLEVVRRIGELRTLGLPILLAHSRKNFIGSVNGCAPGDRDLETHIATALAFEQGARIFRVHDVAGTRRTLDMARALTVSKPGVFAPDAESWPWRAGSSAAHMTNANPDKSVPNGQRW